MDAHKAITTGTSHFFFSLYLHKFPLATAKAPKIPICRQADAKTPNAKSPEFKIKTPNYFCALAGHLAF